MLKPGNTVGRYAIEDIALPDGGGVIRDLLTGDIPVVLQRDIYAVVSLGGAVAVTVVEWLGVPGPLALAAIAVVATGVRLLALRRRWSAPIAVP